MPFLLRLILFLIPSPALLSHSASLPSESQPVQMVISERCISDPNTVEGQEVELTPGSPLVLTHRIRLVPSSASGPCCKAEYAALHERIEALEREVSELREKCGGPDGGCCTSQQSKGAGCTTDQCLNDCNDQGRCVDGKCVCFSGFSGPDCSAPDCPGGCSNKGKCVNGTCVCDPGSTGPDCSIKTCPKNCSSHGRCVKGRCVCDAGFTGPDCSNAQCPGNCNKKGRCVNGKCECNPGFTGPDCSERSCAGNCNNQGRCVNGKCVCEEGFTGADCSERSCPGNCNKKGRCVNGKCVCNPGYTSPDCSERSCPRNCNNNGKCVKGKCVCDAGFTGLDCSEPSCPGNCNKKGRCVNGKCVCDTGFTGADCSERSCPGDCNDRGQCVNGKCVCDAEFTGPDCSEQSCPGNCNDKGRCVNGECVCDTGFTGEDCSERSCPGNCNDNGRCVNGECVCDTGFTGADCSERSCPGNCNGKGRCVDGECVCDTGFTGEDCSERSCPGNCNGKGRCVNGECVCDTGFTGEDCSERSCPGNCNNKGRCVNGKCVCDPGFTGPECLEKSCLNNCNNKGRCVNGKCVCDPGFTGPECLEKSCLNNCNNKGRCVNGKCVCNTGFTGQDCSERSCPGNCNNKGRCVNGKCVCEVGFTGQDCSTKTCPNNCSNKGRCVNGKCVCNPGLAEPDCSECKDGFTGSDCATALVAVSHFSARNITESSVTLFWTPSTLVRYSTYHITFTSEKESDQKITATVNGAMNSYTQVGLAPGQRYTVTIAGEKDGKMGAVSTTTFQTLISGPKHLQVVKTSTTSVIVQWEEAQGEIDRYILYVSPNQTDGSGKGSQEIRLPPGRDSAQIDGLEPGRLYDISVVAEIDGSRSLPATVQAIPGINAGLQDSASRTARGSGEKLSHLRLKNTTKDSSSQYQSIIDSSRRQDPVSSENFVEPTVTTERNITAYGLNNTKYVRTVLIRHRKVHLNRPTNGKALTRNMTLIVGHVSRNDILTNIPDRMAGSSADVGTLDGKGPKLQDGRFEEKSIKEETTPSPSLSPATIQIQHSLVPPETQNQPTKHHIKTSLLLPLSPKNRNSGRPKLSGSSTSLINRQPKMPGYTRPVGNVPSVKLPAVKKETLKEKTVSQESQPDVQDSLIEPKQGLTRDTSVTNLPEDTKITNGDKFPKHQETANKTIPTDHRMLHRGTFPRRPNSGPLQNRTSSPHHSRIPLRRPIVPRFNSTAKNKVNPFIINIIKLPTNKNDLKADVAVDKIISKETSIVFPADNDSNPKANLSLSKDLSESNDTVQPLTVNSGNTIDPISPKVTIRDNSTTRQPIPLHKRVSEFISGRHNGSNSKIRPPFVQKMRNNTVIRRPSKLHTQVNINSTTIHSSLKDSKYETRNKDAKDPSKEFQVVLPKSTDTNHFAKLAFSTETPVGANETFHAISGVLENVIDQTSKDPNLDRVTIRDHNVSEVITGDYSLRRVTPKEHDLPKIATSDGDLLRVTNKDSNSSRQILTNLKLKSDIIGHQENGPNSNVRQSLIIRRKDGKLARILPKPHTQTRSNATRNHSGLKDADTDIVKDVAEGSEPGNDNVLSSMTNRDQDVSRMTEEDQETSRITDRDQDLSRITDSDKDVSRISDKDHDMKTLQKEKNFTTIKTDLKDTDPIVEKDFRESIAFTVQHGDVTEILPKNSKNETVFGSTLKSKIKPHHHGDTKKSKEISTSRHTTPHRHSRPNIPQQRKNGTIIRPPPKVPQLKPNSIAIHDGTKESHKSTDGRNPGWSTEVPFSTRQRNTTHPITEVSKDNINQVGVHNVTSNGFIITWVAPEGRFKNFVIRIVEQNIELTSNHVDLVRSNSTNAGIRKKFAKALPGSARSYPVINLTAQTSYTLTFYGTGPGFRSNVHTVNITTGPEPPSNLTFSDITDSSLKVSWRRPKSKVSGFKVTYIHTKEEEPISVTVDSSSSSVSLTKLSPGSMYEVSVISLLGLDESDPVKDIIMTLPDPPKDLKAINITDTKALLLWRPALANVDQYNITYHPVLAPGSELNIKVSGNAVEQQLHGLKSSTEYSVTIVSQLGEHKSSTTHTSFTTSSGSPGKGEAPRDLRAKQVTARTAVMSWKPPATAVTSYKLTYFIKGGERKEVILNPGVEHKLNGLHPSSTYTALLQAERGGVYTAAISTEFSTGTLRYPYPTDCSQELLNGALSSGLVEIFPAGQQGQPVKVYCDMETDGGGWTVFQRRKDGKTNFFQSWDNYKDGFGDLEGEFWIGNEILHNLTTMTPMSMRVDLRAGDESVYAHYSTFSVDTVKKDYTLRVSGYSGTAGDSMTYHNMRPFSTHNRDPKPFITRCAVSYKGGWWYRNCHEANLNGLYDTHTHHQGVIWTAWKGKKFSIPFTEMKIRPASFKPQRQG